MKVAQWIGVSAKMDSRHTLKNQCAPFTDLP